MKLDGLNTTSNFFPKTYFSQFLHSICRLYIENEGKKWNVGGQSLLTIKTIMFDFMFDKYLSLKMQLKGFFVLCLTNEKLR